LGAGALVILTDSKAITPIPNTSNSRIQKCNWKTSVDITILGNTGRNALEVPCATNADMGLLLEALTTQDRKNDNPMQPIKKAGKGIKTWKEPGIYHKGKCQIAQTTPKIVFPYHNPYRDSRKGMIYPLT
jgi:hypothetical protein